MKWIALPLVAGAIVGAWHRRGRNRARQRQVMLLSDATGLEFAPVDPFPETRWLPFPMFGRTPSGTENVVWDRRHDDVRVFDFWYEEANGDRPIRGRRRFTCAALSVAFSCPRLRVLPRDLLHEVADALGLPEVRVELDAFHLRYQVETEDARFAMAFLDQRVIEAILRLPPDVALEVNEQTLLLWAPLLPPRPRAPPAPGRDRDPPSRPSRPHQPLPPAAGTRAARGPLAARSVESRADRRGRSHSIGGSPSGRSGRAAPLVAPRGPPHQARVYAPATGARHRGRDPWPSER